MVVVGCIYVVLRVCLLWGRGIIVGGLGLGEVGGESGATIFPSTVKMIGLLWCSQCVKMQVCCDVGTDRHELLLKSHPFA